MSVIDTQKSGLQKSHSWPSRSEFFYIIYLFNTSNRYIKWYTQTYSFGPSGPSNIKDALFAYKTAFLIICSISTIRSSTRFWIRMPAIRARRSAHPDIKDAHFGVKYAFLFYCWCWCSINSQNSQKSQNSQIFLMVCQLEVFIGQNVGVLTIISTL